MRKIIIAAVLLALSACARKENPADIQARLKEAMSKFLQSGRDTSKVKFQVLDVYYYEDQTFFECEYKVRMQVPATHVDTVGRMTARVSRDFQTVKRKL
jgi:hypothetical protein